MKIAVIPDTHFPYCDQAKLNNALAIITKFKPDAVVQIGDLYDQVSFSNYPKDPSKTVYNPRQQAQLGKLQAASMWSKVKRYCPKAKRYQLPGNHDARLVKRLTENFPEAAFIGQKFMQQQMSFPGVVNVQDQFILDEIMFMHGLRKMGEHAKWNQMSTVTGHTHQGRIEYFMNREGIYWQMNTGWLGDKQSYPFSYRIQKKIDNTHQGIGLIQNHQPRFVLI